MKGERRRKSRKELFVRQILGAGFGLGGLFVFAIATILSEKGMEPNFDIVVTLFVLFIAIAIALLMSTMQDGLRYDFEDRIAQRNSAWPFFLQDMRRERVMETFQEHGFKPLASGILMKRRSSLRLGIVGCYVHWITVEGTQDEAALDEIAQALNDMTAAARNNTKQDACLCLFVELKNLSEAVRQVILEVSRDIIETTMPLPWSPVRAHTPIITLVDADTGDGSFLEQPKGICTYTYACRMLKKYFG